MIRKGMGGKVRAYGCLQSVGHCTVRAYLHVDNSVIEVIIALGSAQINLTCKVTINITYIRSEPKQKRSDSGKQLKM